MKKPIIVALVLVSACAVLPPRSAAEVGLKAGVSLSKYRWLTPEPIGFDWGSLPFAAGGLYLEAGRGILSLQTGVFFTRMGGRYAVDGDSLEFRFDCLQLPLLVKMNILPSSTVCPFFAFGGYGAYLLKATGVLVFAAERIAEDVTEEYRRVDAGLLFSGGLDFQFSRTTVTLECRYAHGLMKVQKFPDPGETLRHRSIMALAGIGF